MSGVYASWGYVVVGVITPGACACIHRSRRHRLQSLDDPPALTAPARTGSASPSMPQVLLSRFASAMPPPIPSPHRYANGMWVRQLEETRCGVPALRDGTRCRGGGVPRRLRTTAMFQRRRFVMKSARAWSCRRALVRGSLLCDDTAACPTESDAPRAACACAISHSQTCLPCCVAPSRQWARDGGIRSSGQEVYGVRTVADAPRTSLLVEVRAPGYAEESVLFAPVRL
jgi:hypothetical protein